MRGRQNMPESKTMKRIILLLAVTFLSGTAGPAGAAGWYLPGGGGIEWGLAADFSA